MCRRTHGITRMSQGSARNSPEDPRNALVEPRKSPGVPQDRKNPGDLPGYFKQFQTSGDEQGLTGTPWNYKDLLRICHGDPWTTQDQTGVARIGGPWRSGVRSGKV